MERFLRAFAVILGLVMVLFLVVIFASFGAFILEIMGRAYQ